MDRLQQSADAMRLTIGTKLVLTVSALIVVSLTLVGLYLERRERLALAGQLEARLEVQASVLTGEIAAGVSISDAWADRAANRVSARVTVISRSGVVLADSDQPAQEMENHADRPEIVAALAQGSGQAVRFSHTLNRDLVYFARTVSRTPADLLFLRLAAPVSDLAPGFTQFRRDFLGIALVSLLVASVIAAVWARRVTLQLRRMGGFAQDISRGRNLPRLPVEARDELGALAEALNSMAEDLRQTWQRLEDETKRFRTIAQSMGEGLLVLDAKGRISLINPVAERFFGLSRDTALGQNLLEAIRHAEMDDLVRAAAGGTDPIAAEITLIHPHRRILAATAVEMWDGGGTPQGTVITLRDVTQIKRLEEIRMEFVLNVTHELRTPLTAIRGYAETLLDGGLDDRQEATKFLEVILRHAERLGRLLSDLLDLSNIELERAPLLARPLLLPEVIRQVVTTFAQQAEQKGVRLQTRLPETLPAVLADRDRLVQILVNLVDNAVKYTPSGGQVIVAARAREGTESARPPEEPPSPDAERPAEPRWVEIGILDDGIGIPRKELPRITERFYRVDKARSRDLGGTGLGLSIVKHLVQAHDGALTIESDLGKGTEVRFTLPVAPADPPSVS
jgi:two-component system phosphate regulon sensor histidine kinase PhoR